MGVSKRRVLFIDSALPEEIDEALNIGFQGVTTNPSLTAKVPTGGASDDLMGRYVKHMNSIADICKEYTCNDGKKPSLSVEVFSDDVDEMLLQSDHMRSSINYDNLAVKIPISYKGKNYLAVVRELSEAGFDVNCTCCATASQLELAAQAGARYVSLFYNRAIDHFNSLEGSSGDGQERVLRELRTARQYLDDNSNLESEIILGSIRNPCDVVNGWENGADIVTAGMKVVPGLVYNKGTDKWVEGFMDDFEKWK
jgi:transaldolase